MVSVGLIALGVVWLLIPLWLVGSICVGWLMVGAMDRQADALEAMADLLGRANLDGLPPAQLDVPRMEE